MAGQVAPPWMEGHSSINDVEMLVVHMAVSELEGLDALQSGIQIDKKTGLREYSAINEIIEMPQVRQIFEQCKKDIEELGDISPELKKLYKTIRQYEPKYQETPEEEKDPLYSIEKEGRDGDTKLALIPVNLATFLIKLRNGPSINPDTGLLEFGFFKKVFKSIGNILKPSNLIRTAGTIAGGILGGPIGAGLGAGLTNLATGVKPGQALTRGLLSGVGAYGLQGLGQAAGLSGSTPFSGGFFGGAPNALAAGLGGLGIGAHAPAVWSQVGAAAPMAGAAVAGVPTAAATGAGSAGLWDTALKYAPIGLAGLAYMGSRHQHGQETKRYNDAREREEKHREAMGFNESWTPVAAKQRRPNPAFQNRSKLEDKYGIFRDNALIDDSSGHFYSKGGLVKSYKEGTLVKGPGKGQDDKIKTTVPEGAYIIDASSTSDFGDGSSDRGAEILKSFEKHIKKTTPKGVKRQIETQVIRTSTQVPVWLSNDEYKFDPVTVSLLGEGSNEKGADILRGMVKNLRRHKISKGDGLPPKAKHPTAYI